MHTPTEAVVVFSIKQENYFLFIFSKRFLKEHLPLYNPVYSLLNKMVFLMNFNEKGNGQFRQLL